MRLTAPAKLNRFLAVLGRRPDGFHELELVTTVLDGVAGLEDILHLDAAPAPSFTLGGPLAVGLEANADNLVMKAWRLLEREAGCSLPARIHLEKHVPAGGGLGGGSSDAAAALRGGNALFNLGLPQDKLLALAGELGSDVPLFLLGGTVLGLGRGERVFPLRDVPLDPMVLVHPGLHVSTPAVYKALPHAGYPPVLPLPRLPEGEAPQWRNDLTGAAMHVCPALAQVRDALAAVGGEPLLCGSGSCWVARFPTRGHLEPAATALRSTNPAWRVWTI